MIIDRILLYSLPSRIFTGPKDMKRQLRNFIHQQTPLILPMHNRALPHQNTNHRRMKRNGLESQSLWRAAQNLLIAFLFFTRLPLFFYPPLPLFPPLNFCKTAVITGNLQGAHSWTLARCWQSASMSERRDMCVCVSLCVKELCVYCAFMPLCPERFILGEQGSISVLELVYRWGSRGDRRRFL